MKVGAYVLLVVVAFSSMSSATKDAKSEGLNPGDLAPRIESLAKENDFNSHSGRYTLLNFWAAYDGESRASNVRLSNEISKIDQSKISMLSISLDEKRSIFAETVRIDQLDPATQFHLKKGKESSLYKKYKLKNGFNNFLINDKGVIVAKNIPPKKLKEFISSI